MIRLLRHLVARWRARRVAKRLVKPRRMTIRERRKQRESFAYGNTHLADGAVTREVVSDASRRYDAIRGLSTDDHRDIHNFAVKRSREEAVGD